MNGSGGAASQTGGPLRAVVFGLGQLGVELYRVASGTPGLEVIAAVSTRGPAAAVERGLDLEVMDGAAALGRSDVDVVLLAGDQNAHEVADLFGECARAGKDAVTASALFHPRVELTSDTFDALEVLARSRGVRLLSAGVNPGFLLDVLPATTSLLAPGWNSITATRAVEASSWGLSPLTALGVGGAPADLEAGAPLSLRPSIQMLCDCVGLEAVDIEETREAIVSDCAVDLAASSLPSGSAIGFRHRATASDAEGRMVEIRWHAAVDCERHMPAERLGVSIRIDGASPLQLDIAGAFSENPYPATAARMVHGAVAMQGVPPGLLTSADIPLRHR